MLFHHVRTLAHEIFSVAPSNGVLIAGRIDVQWKLNGRNTKRTIVRVKEAFAGGGKTE